VRGVPRLLSFPGAIPLLRWNRHFADTRGRRSSASYACFQTNLEMAMGKYVLAWLLGVPAIVLVVIYLFFH
jgi:hypothetical protein